ncbi:MAG: pilus assembly protein TadG-related protein [Beijerinckiaceae bacterium]
MLKTFVSRSRLFLQDRRGNVAMMFGLCIVGVAGMAGLAVDYSAQQSATARLQSAVDNVALSLARDARVNGPGQTQKRATRMLAAALGAKKIPGVTISAVYVDGNPGRFDVKASGKLNSAFGGIFGIKKMEVAADASVPVVVPSVEVALVLDNTGSMNSLNKLTELKNAATALVSTLQQAAVKYGTSAKIALVPFATHVNIGKSHSSASWLDWSGYAGNTVTWTGCVADRDQPLDVDNSKPTAVVTTHYPVADCGTDPLVPLTANYSGLTSAIANLTANGATNVTIGMAWGLNMLTPGAPLSAAAPAGTAYLNRYMILLTDGMNTQNRWTNDPVQIDARLTQMCTTTKNAGIKVFTIRVIEGNEPLLQSCASDASMYKSITTASELTPTFLNIGKQIMTSIYLGN